MATLQQVVAGFAWPVAVDLSKRDNRARLSAAAIKGLLRITAHWKLKDEDTRALLGGMSSGSFYALKSGQGTEVRAGLKLRSYETQSSKTHATSKTHPSSKAHPSSKTLDQDQLTRISFLIGIYKALNILFSGELADAWIALPNTNAMFGGESPLEYMKKGGIPAFVRVRQLLDARRGGR